jgi:hypothetical protein
MNPQIEGERRNRAKKKEESGAGCANDTEIDRKSVQYGAGTSMSGLVLSNALKIQATMSLEQRKSSLRQAQSLRKTKELPCTAISRED